MHPDSSARETRTHTVRFLKPVPLPIGVGRLAEWGWNGGSRETGSSPARGFEPRLYLDLLAQEVAPPLLPLLDLNADYLTQNQACCHYTKGDYYCRVMAPDTGGGAG